MSLTYSDYLKLDTLLDLQEPKSSGPEHDEVLFIIIHQVYELWFKEMLHELDHLEELFEGNEATRAMHTLKRMLKILKTLVIQIDILETMTPLEFESFRARLESASGFQSFQFRELEFALGRKRSEHLKNFEKGSMAERRLRRRLGEPSLWHVFMHFLAREGYAIPEDVLQGDVKKSTRPSPKVQKILIDLYRNVPWLANICELLVDFDEGLLEWRYRHMRMVERTIGLKQGTGGSSGAAYLKSTLEDPMFPDLWAIRSEL
ncbi:MAG: tryptophan 2,3-dioxygenase [Planctomycetota bacterium]|jgi:tryptophan 2,3-dioxygenase